MRFVPFWPVRISVAMATHQGERFVGPLLESLAAQARPPYELVVCDDASRDGTVALLEAFAERAPFPVHVHPRTEWRGHVETFLEAARRCSGDAIAFCDNDDVWRPQKLAVMGEALERSGATLAMHTTSVVDSELRELGRCWPAIERTETVPPLGLIGLDIDAPGMAMLFRRELLDAADFEGRPPSRYDDARRLMVHDEWIFFLAGVLGPIQLVAEPLVLYRQHDKNDSGGWVDRRRRRTLRGAIDDYEHAAAHTGACADYLERMAAAGGPDAEQFATGARQFRRVARGWALRASLHATADRRRRARLLRELLAQQAYRPRREGGLGRTALGKDLAGVALGARR